MSQLTMSQLAQYLLLNTGEETNWGKKYIIFLVFATVSLVVG